MSYRAPAAFASCAGPIGAEAKASAAGLPADAQIWLMTLYDKDELADLSAA